MLRRLLLLLSLRRGWWRRQRLLMGHFKAVGYVDVGVIQEIGKRDEAREVQPPAEGAGLYWVCVYNVGSSIRWILACFLQSPYTRS